MKEEAECPNCRNRTKFELPDKFGGFGRYIMTACPICGERVKVTWRYCFQFEKCD